MGIIYIMNLDQALKQFVTNDRNVVTHTKIGNPELNIYGNKYFINSENEKKFYDTYKRVVLKEKQEAYITEKQLEIGKIAIDLDFRYLQSVQTKQHGDEHIDDFVEMLINILNNVFNNTENQPLHIYIIEKWIAITCGIVGGGTGAVLSQGDGRWWAIPLGVVTGSMVGCQVDGG